MKRIDRYEILAEIGRGGMASVYKAVHPRLDKYVAIKQIRPDLARSHSVRKRFEHEAELLAQLPAHPNLVHVSDVLTWEENLYVVMDFVDGGTLADLIQSGPVEPGRASELLIGMLTGLEVIHSRGIIHRDLKPSNVLLDSGGAVRISDFGIAEYNGWQGAPVMASAKYAAPELLDCSLGRGGSGAQLDIYAAGMIGYELLLGEALFRREFQQVYNGSETGLLDRWKDWHTNLSCVVRNLTEIDSRIPGSLAGIVERMMAKDVGHRYSEAGQARRDLQPQLWGQVDARSKRSRPSQDDETLPIDRTRPAGGPSRSGVWRRGNDSRTANEAEDFSAARTGRPPGRHRGRISAVPWWAWTACGGGLLLLIVSLTLFLAFMPAPGFTLEVRGAPAGSDVFVDRTRYGLSHPDGRITIAGLRAGTRTVKVSHDGYSSFEDVITGRDGETRTVVTLMKAVTASNVIDYTGEMILIPAGEFTMGDNNHQANERPAHQVSLPDYYIDKFEVTNAQYRKFCDETGRAYPVKLPQYEQYFTNNPDSPVIGIGWDDAVAYAEHYGKRLPSEEEWEKAASWDPATGTKRQYPWGNTPDPSFANLSGQPAGIGRYPNGRSAYGVQDMTGNASEWVADYYKPYPQNQSMDPDYGTKDRVVRGGSFRFKIEDARTTYREHWPADAKAEMKDGKTNKSTIGFRCAVSADDPRLLEVLNRRSR
ncbi:MAG TPA: bifunctional serine/threonine-protein kinase/formylglycine-generating enzyme family protein [Blastocatellia bacterium]|nr:bifunctional serine/threonine-protein kinase/formylglycine-generating enzyme family protein [Blastocatellia bacterium]